MNAAPDLESALRRPPTWSSRCDERQIDDARLLAHARSSSEAKDLELLLSVHSAVVEGRPQTVDLEGLGAGASPQAQVLGAALVAVNRTGERGALAQAVEACESVAEHGEHGELVRRVAVTLTGWAYLVGDPFRTDRELAVRVANLMDRGLAPDEDGDVDGGALAAVQTRTGEAIVRLLCTAAPGIDDAEHSDLDADSTQPLMVRSLWLASVTLASLSRSAIDDRTGELQTLLVANLGASGRDTPISALLRMTLALAFLRAGATSLAQDELQSLEDECRGIGELDWLGPGLLVARAALTRLCGPWPWDGQSTVGPLATIAQGEGYWAEQAGRLIVGDREPDAQDAITDFHPVAVARAASRVAPHSLAAGEFVVQAGVLSDALVDAGYRNNEAIASLRVAQAELLLRLGRTKHALRVCDYVFRSLLEDADDSCPVVCSAQVTRGRALISASRYADALEVLGSVGEDTKPAQRERTFLRGVAAYGAGDMASAVEAFHKLSDPSVSTGDGQPFSGLATRWLNRLSGSKIHENGAR